VKSIQLNLLKRQKDDEVSLDLTIQDVGAETGIVILNNLFAIFGGPSMHITQLAQAQAAATIPHEAVLVDHMKPTPEQLAEFYKIFNEAPIMMPQEEPVVQAVTVQPADELIRQREAETAEFMSAVEKIPERRPPEGRSRALPIVNHEHRSNFSISDDPKMAALLKSASSIVTNTVEPAAPVKDTGIKIEDHKGTLRSMYRAVYDCPCCGFNGRRYVLPTQSFVACFDCKKLISIRPVRKERLTPDKDMVFFYGNEQFLSAQERWERKNGQQKQGANS
jgi:hypothetical protein